MKNWPTLKIFLVYKHAPVIRESSLNDFKISRQLDSRISQKKMRTSLQNAGLTLQQATRYHFPADPMMYVGFGSETSAINYLERQSARQQKKKTTDKAATTLFILRYQEDMSHHLQIEPLKKVM